MYQYDSMNHKSWLNQNSTIGSKVFCTVRVRVRVILKQNLSIQFYEP